MLSSFENVMIFAKNIYLTFYLSILTFYLSILTFDNYFIPNMTNPFILKIKTLFSYSIQKHYKFILTKLYHSWNV